MSNYVIETRAFCTLQAEHLEEKEENEALENRAKESRREMDVIDALEDILHTNAHKAIADELLIEPEKQELTRQEKEDQDLIKKIFFRSGINRPDDEEEPPPAKMAKIASPS